MPTRLPLHRHLASATASAPQTPVPEVILPPNADVVVIGKILLNILLFYYLNSFLPEFAGGGNLGCNVTYQLARRGVNAVLLERDKLTSGTTWHTSGLIWRLRPSDTDIELLNRTVGLLGTIEAETGLNPGWKNNGGLFIANNKVK